MNLLQILVFLFSASLCYASLRIQPNATHPDYPDRCVSTHGPKPIILRRGETVQNKFVPCGIVSCTKDLSLEWQFCSAIGRPDGCLLKEDLSLPYPDCCPQLKCSPED